MTQSTSILHRLKGNTAISAEPNHDSPAYLPPGAPMDMSAAQVLRRVPAVAPEARIAVAIEMVKASPYRTVPVIGENKRLVGLITEAGLSRLLLGAATPEERAKIRESPVSDAMETCEWWTVPMTTVSEVSWLFDHAHKDVLPVLGPESVFYGMIGRGDLVQELSRPFQPPTIGGMATPLGVYLTTGRVSGGAGTLGLMLTGVFMAAISVTALSLIIVADAHLPPLSLPASVTGAIPAVVRTAIGDVIGSVLGALPLLLALRFSPIAGYHAAEHQVVHAVERGEPLLVEAVRAMPRVHPRCGTNIVAAVFLATTVYTAFAALPGGLNFVVAGLVALLYWRSLGSWLQQYVTTRPATDRQIESAIFAARDVLTKHSTAPDAPTRPLSRLWRMGLPQILLGFAAVLAFAALLAWLFPALGVILNPILHDLIAN